MSNAFDIERAKSGESFEYRDIREWVSARFIGLTSLGNPVIELLNGRVLDTFTNSLRMSPKKIKVRYRVAALVGINGSAFTLSVNDEREMRNAQTLSGFTEWLTDWIEAEVEQ